MYRSTRRSAAPGISLVTRMIVSVVLLGCLVSLPHRAWAQMTLKEMAEQRDSVSAFLEGYLVREWDLSGTDAARLAGWVTDYSLRYETDPFVQMARLLKESHGQHFVPSRGGGARVKRGGHHEIGVSQIMPSWIGKTVGGKTISREMLFSEEGNVEAGILIFKRYDDGDAKMALARYNSPGARRPNRYARSVWRIYEGIWSAFDRFQTNPTIFASLGHQGPAGVFLP
jgi:hypothetical protein